MKKTTLLFAFLFAMQMFSQSILNSKEIKLNHSFFKDNREILPIVDENKNQTAVFFMDSKKINAFLYDNNFKQIDSITTIRPESKYAEILGYTVNEDNYNIFFSKLSKKEILVKTFNFSTKKESEDVIYLNFDTDVYLQSISYKNKFYILSINKNSSIFNIYDFEGNKLLKANELDFSSYTFSNKNPNKVLYNIIEREKGTLDIKPKLNKINTDCSTALDIASEKSKIYVYDNKFYLTFDNDNVSTNVITIDLKDYKHEFNTYFQPQMENNDTKTKSNSFLSNNLLFQLNTTKEEMCISIKNINDKSINKEYRFKKNEEVSFKNTPLIKEGSMYQFNFSSNNLKKKELDDTEQFLNKVGNGDVAITVYSLKNQYVLTIGGTKETVKGSFGVGFGNMGGFGAGVGVGLGGSRPVAPSLSTFGGFNNSSLYAYNYNPYIYNYNKYKGTRSIYFKTLLNQNDFTHEQSELNKNAFDKIADFEDKDDGNLMSKTIFKFGSYFVYGVYLKEEAVYILRKFED